MHTATAAALQVAKTHEEACKDFKLCFSHVSHVNLLVCPTWDSNLEEGPPVSKALLGPARPCGLASLQHS